MAVDFRINDLGGLNIGQAVNQGYNIYQQQRQNTMQDEALAKQETQQAELQWLMAGAAKGDADAIETLYSRSPKLAAQFEQRDLARAEREGQQAAQASKQKEVEFATRYRAASPDQKQLLLQEAAADAMIDIDDEDLALNPDQAEAAVNLMLFQNLGKDGFNALTGAGGDKTSDIKNYEYRRSLTPEERAEYDRTQGRDTTTPEQKFNIEKKKADLDVKTTQTKEERKQGVAALQGIAQKSREASKIIAQANMLERLNEKALSGTGADLKLDLLKLGDALGLKVEGVSESELLRAVANDMVLSKSQEMSGALSEGDMKFLSQTAPQLSQTTEGRQQLASYSKALAERQKDYAKKAQKFRQDNGYFNQSEFDVQFDAANKPLFDIEQTTQDENVGQQFTSPNGISYTVSEG